VLIVHKYRPIKKSTNNLAFSQQSGLFLCLSIRSRRNIEEVVPICPTPAFRAIVLLHEGLTKKKEPPFGGSFFAFLQAYINEIALLDASRLFTVAQPSAPCGRYRKAEKAQH